MQRSQPADLREAIQARLQPALNEYARELADATGLAVRAGSSFNDAFILRTYVEADRADDTEVALTVDVLDRNGVVTVESCIYRDDGYILKEGPELRVSAEDELRVLASFGQWMTQLDEYLRANRQYLIDLLS